MPETALVSSVAYAGPKKRHTSIYFTLLEVS